MRERLARAGLYAGAFLGPFGAGVTVAMLPELGATFGISPGTAASSVTAYLLPFAALMLVSGTLGERWGRRRTVVVAYCAYVLAALASVFASTFTLFLLTRALQGVANAFTTPLLLSAVAGLAAPGRTGRALGWFASLQAAGQTSAPLLGGLAAELDWRQAFVGVAAVAAVLAGIGIPAPAQQPTERPALRTAFRLDVLRIGVVAALGWGALAGLNFLVALRLTDEFDVPAATRGLVLTVLGVVGLLSARLVGVNAAVFVPGRVNPTGSMSVVQAVRFGGGGLSPVAITPIYHADPIAAFLAPALAIAVLVPIVLPRAPYDPASTTSNARA